MVNWEAGGRLELDGDHMNVIKVTDVDVVVGDDSGFWQMTLTRASLDARVLRGEAFYRSPAIMQAVAASVGRSSWENEIARAPFTPKASEAAQALPTVFCLVCDREIKGAVTRNFMNEFSLNARCCGKSEHRIWKADFVEKINGAGGKWVAFLSHI